MKLPRPRITAIILVVLVLAAAAGLFLLGWWIPNRPSTKDFPVRGIDVSHHQGMIDWKVVAKSGLQFVYIKASEGADYKDPEFKGNWAGAQNFGIARGAYHFFLVNAPGKEQAEHFIALAPDDPLALPPVVDVELSGANQSVESVEKFQAELKTYIDIVSAHYHKPVIVYANASFRDKYLKGMRTGPLWLSDLILRPSSQTLAGCMFWQYSERGKVPGIDGFVDLDVYCGDAQGFHDLLNASAGK